jgi:hypothetical protein
LRVFKSELLRVSLVFLNISEGLIATTTTAINMAKIAITINNSIRVKDEELLL